MNRRDEIRTFVIDNFLFGAEGDIQDDTPFLENGIVDSTGVLALVGFLEERFGIRVEDDEIMPENLDSLRRICTYLERKLAGKASV